MKYSSTRGGEKGLKFEEAVMKGLAQDGGLFIPESIPKISLDDLAQWKDLKFHELASKIMRLYIDEEEVPDEDLKRIAKKSFETFSHPLVTPVKKISKSLSILELFHGPTFAFKDVALQFLGNLFEYFLSKESGQNKPLTIIGATSGDTGSAAIYGLRGKKNIDVFILFPNGRVSPVQEKQMTTVLDSNIHCLSLDGTFDDCQNIVKQLFNDPSFSTQYRLGAINSINWARILAQTVYYVSSYLQVTGGDFSTKVSYSVPTGNFGDILAGFYSRQMGLPIDKLIIATNQNDILDRFMKSGCYERKEEALQTLSPAMDIQISSNFERYMFYLCGSSHQKLKELMDSFNKTKKFEVSLEMLEQARSDFLSESVTDEETMAIITKYFKNSGKDQLESYCVCPHTAVGISAAEKSVSKGSVSENNLVCLATAHPAKFIDTVSDAIGQAPESPEILLKLENLETRVTRGENSTDSVKSIVNKILSK